MNEEFRLNKKFFLTWLFVLPFVIFGLWTERFNIIGNVLVCMTVSAGVAILVYGPFALVKQIRQEAPNNNDPKVTLVIVFAIILIGGGVVYAIEENESVRGCGYNCYDCEFLFQL